MRSAILLAMLAVAASGEAAKFTVTNVNDSGVGSLRWAIEQANANSGPDEIAIQSYGTILLSTPLPAITDAASFDFGSSPITIDGTNAGATDGLVLAAGPVFLFSPLTVKNFTGTGIVVQAHAVLQFVSSSNNRDGVRIESDYVDVRGGRFTNNARYGIWLTRAASGDRIGVPEQECHFECVPQPGGNDVDGNGSTGILVEGDNNIIDTARVGTGAPNGGDGIVVTGAHNTIVNSILANNPGFGANLMTPARFQSNSGDCNGRQLVGGSTIAPPRVTLARADPTAMTVAGELRAAPNATYTIEINDARRSCPVTYSTLLATVTATTDSSGFAAWQTVIGLKPVAGLTAMATRGDAEETSRRSETMDTFISGDHRVDLGVHTTGPTIAASGQIVQFETVVTNYGPSAIDYVNLSVPLPPNTQFVSADTTSGGCWLDGLQFCGLAPLAAGERAIIHERLRVNATSGRIHYAATVRSGYPGGTLVVDPNSSNDTASVDVPITPLPRSRPARH